MAAPTILATNVIGVVTYVGYYLLANNVIICFFFNSVCRIKVLSFSPISLRYWYLHFGKIPSIFLRQTSLLSITERPKFHRKLTRYLFCDLTTPCLIPFKRLSTPNLKVLLNFSSHFREITTRLHPNQNKLSTSFLTEMTDTIQFESSFLISRLYASRLYAIHPC
jgi:hypothetical protein